MRTIWLALAIALSPLAIVNTGCHSPPQAVAYQSLRATVSTVNASMSAYLDAVVAGKVNAQTQLKVRQAYDLYQPAMTAAIIAARYDYASATPETVAQLAAELLAAITPLLQ